MNEIKAVIWDMGGVILRSEARTSRMKLAEKYQITADELYNLVFNSESARQATVGLIEESEHWNNIGKSLGIAGQTLLDFQEQFWADDAIDQKLTEFIRSLKDHYKTALLSNAWSNARKMLTYERKCMDVFQYSMFSCEVKLAKPDPAIYREILKLTGVEPREAIFVDDNLDNILAANQMQIHGIQFINSQQARNDVQALLTRNGS